MKINLDAWQLNNPDWVAQRKQKWKKIKAYWDTQNHWIGDFVRENKKACKKFYDTGVTDIRYLNYREFATLHPKLTLQDMRSFLEEKKLTSYLFSMEPVELEFIETGIAPEDINHTVLLALVGEDYHQAAKLRGFEPKLKAPKALKDSLMRVKSYFVVAHYRYFPIELAVDHIKSIFTYID